jgi:osmotically-inducible protein OsmY
MTVSVVRSDAQVQRDVLRELHWDPRVEERGVAVDVKDGGVTLTGTAGSWAARRAAVAAARRILGVREVADRMVVAVAPGFARSDADLTAAVRCALQWDVRVPEHGITATVADGWVRLTGRLDLWSHREDAEHAIENLKGVRGVSNDITVLEPARTSADVREAIEEALERRAERSVGPVTVRIEDGTAILFGAVRSWSERQAIVAAARYTRGVQAVDDRLRMDPLG